MKKFYQVMLILMLMLTLSSCQLAKENPYITPVIEDQELIGIYLQMVDPSNMETSLLPEFGDEDAYHFYHVYAVHGGYEYMDTIASPAVINLYTKVDVLDNTVNGVTTRTQTISYAFDIMIGRSHMGDILYIQTIIKGDEPTLANGSSGHMLSDVIMTSTYRDDVIIDDLTTEVIFIVTYQMVDELISVDLIEMNEDHTMIGTTTFNEPLREFTVSALASYVIIEQTFQDAQGNTYQERRIVEQDEYVLLHFLNDDGFVTHEGSIHLIFE